MKLFKYINTNILHKNDGKGRVNTFEFDGKIIIMMVGVSLGTIRY